MLTLFGFETKKYHPRRTHTKSRAGCLTCKYAPQIINKIRVTNPNRKRRVKCDETHPTCHQCIRTGWSCSWPDIQPHNKVQSQSHQVNQYSSLPSAIPSRIFQTQRETHFFDFFRLHTVIDLSGWSPSSFWQRLVLQMVHTEPAARQAAIALGALHLEGLSSTHALRLYGGALAALRSALLGSGSESVPNMDACLTTCLLLSCFEIAREDCTAAQIHYKQGLAILKHCSNHGVQSRDDPALVTEEPIQTTFSLFEMHIIAFLSNRPSPGYTPDNGYAASAAAQTYPSPLGPLSLSIPNVFPSLSSAAESYLRIQRAIQSATTQITYQLAFSQPVPVPDLEGLYPHRESYGASLAFPEVLEEVLREGLRLLQTWESAFEALITSLGRGDGGNGRSIQDERTVSLLRGHAAILMIRRSRDPSLGEMGYDIFRESYLTALLHFETATDLAWAEKQAINETGPKPLFSLSLGVLHALYDLVAKCRDLHIRRRGLDLLSRMPFREGLWDGPNARRVIEAILSFEEMNRLSGIEGPEGIPEEYRTVGVNFVFTPGRFKIIADSMRGRGVSVVELD
ncbi:hypothetical protein BJX68DRAFT_268209 [Aspergillus pseudodeflectus]|uniref:Zn(2)-C6 fungal-type domain-containing protein n=1 Tax=Aspergillus pseudodeflectus TaxID=176178 RepID=A0ABR4K4U6_9EURO